MTDETKARKPRKPRDLGPLHALLIRGLPDWVDEDGLLRVYDLARHIGISYQAAYAFLARGRVPPKRINSLVYLSQRSKDGGPDFTPLTHSDFAEFFE